MADTGRRVLFDGADLRVICNTDFADDVAFVTFSSRRGRKEGFRREGFGESFLASEGIAHVCFVNKANHWWQTPELPAAMALLKQERILARYTRTVSYGASMGGFGALLAADLLDLDLALAFSPQFRVDGSLPLMAEWSADLTGRPIIAQPFGTRPPRPGQITLAYDPINAIDRTHARALERLAPCRTLAVAMGTHSAALHVQHLGVLKDLMRAAATKDFATAPIRRALRVNRRTSPEYWQSLAQAAAARGRTRLATIADERAFDLSMADSARYRAILVMQARRMVATALDGKNLPVAREIARRLAEACPDEVEALLLLSRIESAAGNLRRAVRLAKSAIALAPASAKPLLTLALALIAGERAAAAAPFIEKAAGRKDATYSDWLQLAGAYEAAGDLTHALAAVDRAAMLRPAHPKVRARQARIKRLVGGPA